MSIFDTIYSVFIIFVFLVIGISFIYEKKARISPTPVLPHVRLKALTLLPSRFIPSGTYKIADLGCGWGSLLLKLSRLFPEASITGYEISPFPFLLSWLRSSLFSSNISVHRSDFFKADISAFDIVFCYLSPWHMNELKDHFLKMKPGSVVISCSFPIDGWRAERTDSVKSLFVSIPVFLYVIK